MRDLERLHAPAWIARFLRAVDGRESPARAEAALAIRVCSDEQREREQRRALAGLISVSGRDPQLPPSAELEETAERERRYAVARLQEWAD